MKSSFFPASCTMHSHMIHRYSAIRNSLRLRSSRNFFFSSPVTLDQQSVGVFGMVGLHRTEDWHSKSKEAIEKCNHLRHELKQFDEISISNAERQLVILDSISNTICSVIDVAELCRNVHSDEGFRHGAEESFALLSSYINELNTDSSMYDVLVKITNDINVMKSLEEEDRRFANALRNEFERDGIQLSTSERNELRELNNNIDQIQTIFSQTITHGVKLLHVPKKLLNNVHPSLWSEIPQSSSPNDCYTLSTDARTVGTILNVSDSPMLRQTLYKNMHNVCDDNVKNLSHLVSKRQKLAKKLGHNSFSDLMLQDKMMQSPKQVCDFLYSIAEGLKPKAEEEMKELLTLKLKHEKDLGRGIEQWDLPYYTALLKSSTTSESLEEEVSKHLPLQTCISGLCTLTESLFGVKVSREIAPSNESWDHSIEKLTLIHPIEGMLGTIYLDLHPREGKFGHSAHFTVSCGCETSESQLPVVALVMNFFKHNNSCYLTHQDLETLLHEYGHAIHSLLSRTKYQHLSGTRVSQDFVETPSQLFEFFTWDLKSLSFLSSHVSTGKPINQDILNKLIQSQNELNALNTLHQVLLALFDMELYSLNLEDNDHHISEEEISKLAHDLHVKIMPQALAPPGVNWFNRFSHLTTYGATYYGYMLNKAYATQLWDHLFEKDSLSRSSGEKVWLELLRPGGSKEPMELLTACLDGNTPSLEPFFHRMNIKK